MKQYCRYCAFCIDNGYNDLYCTDTERFIKFSTAKASNKCKDYSYCGNDVITGKEHWKQTENIFKAKESEEE